MSNILNLSADELEDWQFEVFTTLVDKTRQLRISFFIIGATARDLIMSGVHGAPIRRATRDIDFAVCVESWGRYEALKQALVEVGYRQDTNRQQRLLSSHGHIIDIIPFGPIAETGEIAWPPDWGTIMSVVGFEEALQSAIDVNIYTTATAITIRVANPPGVALLKLIAWQERNPSIRKKDAQDLAYLCQYYAAIDDVSNRLYEQDFMARFDHEQDFASAYALGFDVSQIAGKNSSQAISELLFRSINDNGFDLLVEEAVEQPEIDRRRKQVMFAAFRQGFLDGCTIAGA